MGLFNSWFKKKPEPCSHEYQFIKKLYRDARTDYNNGHDVVHAYDLERCKYCNEGRRETVIRKTFPVYRPDWPSNRNQFIKKVEESGFVNEDDYTLEKSK